MKTRKIFFGTLLLLCLVPVFLFFFASEKTPTIRYTRVPINNINLTDNSSLPLPPPKTLSSETTEIYRSTNFTLSKMWLPIVMDKCPVHNSTDHIAKYYAPCLKDREYDKKDRKNLAVAHEILYLPFKFRIPGFVSQEQKQKFLTLSKEKFPVDRFRYIEGDNDWAVFDRNINGQNLIFENSIFHTNYPKGWSDDSCMGHRTPHSPFYDVFGYDPTRAEEFLIVATSPDSFSFQHYLDRVTNIALQARLSVSYQDISVIFMRRPTFSAGNFFMEALNFSSTKVYTSGNTVHARNLLYSCRSILIHPYLMLAFSEKVGLYKEGVPELSERKKVVFFRRGGSRKITNENALIDAIGDLLEQRGQGEILDVRSSVEPIHGESLEVTLRNFAKETRAIIGPHGGALYNGRFAFPQTLVIEFQPVSRFGISNLVLSESYFNIHSYIFLEQSRSLYQNYWQFLLEPGASDSMQVEIGEVIQLLDKELGVEYDFNDILQPIGKREDMINRQLNSYPWSFE